MADFRGQMAQAAGAVRSFASEANKAAVDGARGFAGFNSSLDDTAKRSQALIGHMGGLRAALAGIGATAGVAFGTKLAANLEQTQVAFTGILGSGQEAETFVRRLQQFAAVTPFTFTGLTQSTQQLLALGKTGDQALNTLTIIGDAVAAMGGGEEEVQGVVRAITQISAKGRLAAQDMNQISERLPTVQRAAVFDVLAEKMGKTREEVAALAETGQISADQGLDALFTVMQQLPGAAGAMERQSRTLTGVISSLKDQLTIAAGVGFGPLASAIRDAVFPLLQQLGNLLRDILIPVGGALGDAFRGIAGAFTTLAPSLPGLADAFASLLSAVAPLIPAAAELLDVVLVPLVPALQAVAGLLEGLLNIPGVVTAIQALTAAFLVLKAVQVVQLFGGIQAATVTMGLAAGAARAQMVGLSAVLAALPAYSTPVGLAIIALTTAIAVLKADAAGAEEVTNLFTDAIQKGGDAAKEASLKIIAAKIGSEDLQGALEASGTSARTFADGVMTGGEAAANLRNRWTELYEQGVLSKAQFDVLYNTLNDLGGTYDLNARDAKALDKAQLDLGVSAGSATGNYQKLADAVSKAFSPTTALQGAVKALGESEQESSKNAVDAIRDRYDAKKRLLDDEQRAEKQALDKMTQARKDALDEQLQAEKDTIDAEHKARMDALDDQQRAEKDAFDRETRARKDALDDQQRLERHALDERLDLIDEEADKRKKAENRRWEDERDQIKFMIDSTFGEEREAWKQRLVDSEDAHDDQVGAIEDAADEAKTAEKDGLDDRERLQNEKLADQTTDLQNHLDDKQEAEDNAETTRYNAAVTAFDNRATLQKQKLDDEVTDLQNHLDDKYRRLDQNLKDLEAREVTGEQSRRTKVKGEQDLTLAQYQTFLDGQLAKADKFNQDLAIIASRGGSDVMEEIAKLPPALVAQAAAAGPAAFAQFLESIRTSLASGTLAPGLPSGLGGTIRFKPGQQAAEGHVATIAMSGPRLWAEPETGGEAYIPLGWSKRARGESVLAQTASIMGYDLIRMAGGGFVGLTASAAGRGAVEFNVPISIEAHVAAGVDPDAVGRAIAVHARRAVDEALDTIGRQVVMKSWRA